MPCDASFLRRLRAGVLAMAIISFGLVAGAPGAFAQGATPSGAPDAPQASPGSQSPAGGDSAAPPAEAGSTLASADGATTEPPESRSMARAYTGWRRSRKSLSLWAHKVGHAPGMT